MNTSSRNFHDMQDLEEMRELLVRSRRGPNDWGYWHVGDLVWRFFLLSERVDPCEHIRLWYTGTGLLVGYAVLGDDVSMDWQIAPEYVWQGIEEQALDWAQERLAALRRQDAAKWSGKLISPSVHDDMARMTFLEQNRFSRGGETSLHFLRNLGELIASPQLPPGYKVRAVNGDAEIPNRASAHREAYSPSRVTDASYARLRKMSGYDEELDIVAASPDNQFATYALAWIDPVSRIGEFEPVGARPDFRRQGLTRAVLLEGLARMRARGMQWAWVSTGSSNLAAVELYESVGFRIVSKDLSLSK